MGKTKDLVQRAFGLLVLKTIALEPNHGWAVAKRLQQVSRDVLRDVLQVQQGSLYLASHRLEQKAGIRAKWAETDTVRRAKFNSLTAAAAVPANWGRLSAAVKPRGANLIGGCHDVGS